jgi:Spy/CpxP family protein refolding chaperone
MRKTVLTIAALVVAMTALSFAVARWTAMHCQPAAPVNLHDPAWLKRQLNLSEAQAAQVEAAEKDFQKSLDAFCAAHCAARMALGDELARPAPDPDKARAAVEKMNAVQADSERATLAHILKVRALLDPQQAQLYSAMVHDQVCTMPMGTP